MTPTSAECPSALASYRHVGSVWWWYGFACPPQSSMKSEARTLPAAQLLYRPASHVPTSMPPGQ